MTDETPDESTDEIRFVPAHRPDAGPADGAYTVAVSQDVIVNGALRSTRRVSRQFVIAGEHRSLAPADVVAVFPPEGSLGDHSAAFPHILLSRSTLPWEQDGDAGGSGLPWLAVLLLDDEDAATGTVTSVGELRATAEFRDTPQVPGQSDDDRVAVLGVEPGRLAELLPTGPELALLAHVRERGGSGQPSATELAAVVGNRLPRGGGTSTAHLVSVAGRYRNGTFDTGPATGGLVHLVSLRSWRFACVPDGPSFEGMVTALNRTPGTPSLPPTGRPITDPYLARGHVALPHRLRQADRTVSWYHGPLSPQRTGPVADDPLPARAADALLRLDTRTGMLDVSYAAAWQLGRLLALRSRRFATGWYDWRRAHRRTRLRQVTPIPLPGDADDPGAEPPAALTDWLAGLDVLTDVPFDYLVPDDRMAPAESVRTFCLDGFWVRCLRDGALSLGRVTRDDRAYDAEHLAHLNPPDPGPVTGLLLHSALVAGWPGMRVDAYDTAPRDDDVRGPAPMTSLRTGRLGGTVLLCLFAGTAEAFRLSLRPETLHFGVDHDPDAPTGLVKRLRDDTGTPGAGPTVPVSRRAAGPHGAGRVVDVAALAGRIGSGITSARFAADMVEGAPSVLLHRAQP